MFAFFEGLKVHLPQRCSVGISFFFNLFLFFFSQDLVKVVVYSFYRGLVMVLYCSESVLNVTDYYFWNSFYTIWDNG